MAQFKEVRTKQLWEKFSYLSYGTVRIYLYRLQRKGFVERLNPGFWRITEDGLRKVEETEKSWVFIE